MRGDQLLAVPYAEVPGVGKRRTYIREADFVEVQVPHGSLAQARHRYKRLLTGATTSACASLCPRGASRKARRSAAVEHTTRPAGLASPGRSRNSMLSRCWEEGVERPAKLFGGTAKT